MQHLLLLRGYEVTAAITEGIVFAYKNLLFYSELITKPILYHKRVSVQFTRG